MTQFIKCNWAGECCLKYLMVFAFNLKDTVCMMTIWSGEVMKDLDGKK